MEKIITTVTENQIFLERKLIEWIFQAYGKIPSSPFNLVVWERDSRIILKYPPAIHSLEEKMATAILPCKATEQSDGKISVHLPETLKGRITLTYWNDPVRGLLIESE